MESKPCPYKPITCQEARGCQNCWIYNQGTILLPPIPKIIKEAIDIIEEADF